MYDTDERRSRLFTVRVWTEGTGVAVERRGRVQDVESGAFRSFRRWHDLTAFIAEQLGEDTTEEETP